MEHADIIVSNIFPIVAAIVLAVLPFLLEAFRRYLKAKHNFEVSQAVIHRYKEFAYDGVSFAEEQVCKSKKAKEEMPDSAAKLDMAFGYVAIAAKAGGLPEWAEEQIKQLIEAVLYQDREEQIKQLIESELNKERK